MWVCPFQSGSLSFFIEQCPWEANSFSASQEDPQTFWDLRVLYSVYECLLLVPILIQSKSVQVNHVALKLFSVSSSIVRICLGLAGGLFPSCFSTEMSHIPIPFIVADLITLITYGGQWKPGNSILTHCGWVTQICVFNTVKLGTSASSP